MQKRIVAQLSNGQWHYLIGKLCPKCQQEGQPSIYSEKHEKCPGHGCSLINIWSKEGLDYEPEKPV